MAESQLQEASDLADEVYPPELAEPYEAFYSRWFHYPPGAIVMYDRKSSLVCGYGFFHPWHDGEIIPLGTVIDGVPNSRTCYFHDMAILPELQGQGYGADFAINIMNRIRTQGFRRCVGVSVLNSLKFWCRLGFHPIEEISYGGLPGVRIAIVL